VRLAGVALQHAQRLNVFPWIGGLELQKKVDMAWISSGYPGFQHATYISGFLGFRGSKPKIWVSDLQYLDLTSFKPKAFKESLGGFREKCMFEHV